MTSSISAKVPGKVTAALVMMFAVFSTSQPAALRTFQKDYAGSLVFGGFTRTYLVHLPPSYDGTQPTPLVFALHGGGGNAEAMDRLTHLNKIADSKKFIVVYPNGYKESWADGRGTTKADRDGINDVGFISAVIGKLAGELRIDLDRVYVTGASNGGFMSQRLAGELSSRIAAIATVIATMPENLSEQCKPQRPISVIVMNGTNDPFVPWEGGEVTIGAGGKILSAQATVKKWVELNGCSSAPAVTYEPNKAIDGTRVRREAYSECKDKTEVILYAVEGGGHTWPGGLQYLPAFIIGRTSRDIDAGEVIWDFFRKHSLEPAKSQGEESWG